MTNFRPQGGRRAFPPPCRIIWDFVPKSGTPFLTLFKKFSKIFLDFLKIFFGIDRKFFWDRSNFFNGFSNFLKFAPNNFCRNYKEKIFQIFFPKNGFLSNYMVLGSQKNIFGKLRSFLKISEKHSKEKILPKSWFFNCVRDRF